MVAKVLVSSADFPVLTRNNSNIPFWVFSQLSSPDIFLDQFLARPVFQASLEPPVAPPEEANEKLVELLWPDFWWRKA